MAVQSKANVTVTTPTATETVITAVVEAPRDLVFKVITTPEHVSKWWGIRRAEMASCDIDLRPGGKWRYVLRDQKTGGEDAFSGVYREIVPPERLVYTEGWEKMPGHEYVVTATLDERHGKTTITSRLQYQSTEDRDGHLHSGMEWGMRETYDRLAEHLASLK